ncbi:MAG: hypothetical protein M3209_00330 [Acidobacteriota bacterium]|nr:hypothetical protein [Acidobacteriota bacterium]
MTALLTRQQLARKIMQLPPERQAAAWKKAIEFYGPAPQNGKFKPYKYKPAEYISTFLKWNPWESVIEGQQGQSDILAACARAMLQQEEKDKFDKGELTGEELTAYSPDEPIRNWIRVESGNGIGKTKSASGILNWFLDCFTPSAIFTFAPGGDQARFAIWSEIRGDRENKGLPGRILEKEIKVSAKHFAAHRTVSDAHGKGEERLKGKHEAFQLFILDEADGITDTVFDSIVSMTSGGNSLVVMFANPKSRASMFHRCKARSYVQSFRVSTLYHPNVVEGWEVIPGAVKRDFVEKKLEDNCEIVSEHNDDDFTFELPYDVTVAGKLCSSGTIFKPNARFMTDVLGITPPNSSDKTLIPVGRYEAATKRQPNFEGDITKARIGIDAARFGSDTGTVYTRWLDMVWRDLEISQGETDDYFHAIKPIALKLKEKGVTSLHFRVDAGYGSGLIDKLRSDDELKESFADYQVYEVHFGGSPYSDEYYHLVTEMYAEAGESLKSLCVLSAPDNLEMDLCEREYKWRNKSGKDVKILEAKADFRKRKKHSPDDGDGFVLAVAPDYLFQNSIPSFTPARIVKQSSWF